MRPLRYSINVTLDGCCDHRAMVADEDLHRHAVENLDRADALLFGRVTYEMMEAGWRRPVPAGARPDWMEPFARTIDAARKYVVSTNLTIGTFPTDSATTPSRPCCLTNAAADGRLHSTVRGHRRVFDLML